MKRFNIVDLVFLVLIIAVGVGGYWYLTKDNGGSSSVETGKTYVKFTAVADNVLAPTVDSLKVGDAVIAKGYVADAKIIDISISDATTVSAKDGELFVVSKADRKKVTVTIEGYGNQYGPYMDLAGQAIKAGVGYIIRTESFEATGQILSVLDSERPLKAIETLPVPEGNQRLIRFEAISYTYEPETFNHLVEGVQLVEDKKYLQGHVVSVEVQPFIDSVLDNNGEVVHGEHPNYDKALITIEAVVTYEDEAFKFGNQEIREAKPFFIFTEHHQISTVVSAVEVIGGDENE